MTLLADSISTVGNVGYVEADAPVGIPGDSLRHNKLTPKQIIDRLPHDATPAQQDSAVQANISPSDIHWSSRPDTLHLPGYPAGRSVMDVSLPQYYRESYFTGRPCFHPDLFGGRLGTAGDPVPYSIARDNVITLLLLGCFILAAVGFSQSRIFMIRQAKEFFRVQHGELTEITETAAELRFQFFLALQTCLLIGLMYFFYVQLYVTDMFIVDQYAVIGTFGLMGLAYVIVKAIGYWFSGWVFFGIKRTESWMKSFLFILSLEGLCMFPIVMFHAYFGVSVKITLVCTAIVAILFRILTFYKTYVIFFRHERSYVQNILYFCTLEIVPMAALLGLLDMTSSYLKVSF